MNTFPVRPVVVESEPVDGHEDGLRERGRQLRLSVRRADRREHRVREPKARIAQRRIEEHAVLRHAERLVRDRSRGFRLSPPI